MIWQRKMCVRKAFKRGHLLAPLNTLRTDLEHGDLGQQSGCGSRSKPRRGHYLWVSTPVVAAGRVAPERCRFGWRFLGWLRKIGCPTRRHRQRRAGPDPHRPHGVRKNVVVLFRRFRREPGALGRSCSTPAEQNSCRPTRNGKSFLTFLFFSSKHC